MNTTATSKPILFPGRPSSAKDGNGHGANAFTFGSNEGLTEQVSQIFSGAMTNSGFFFEKTSSAARENMKTVTDLLHAVQIGVTQWNEKILANTIANTEAALNATKAMSSVHRVEDLARLQNDFFQKQMSTATEQSKELFQLSSQIFQNTFAAFQAAALRSFETPMKFK